jgi:hypothetical protein
MKMQAKNAMETLRKKAYSSTWKKMPPARTGDRAGGEAREE